MNFNQYAIFYGVVLGAAVMGVPASAQEINYGHISEIKGDSLLLEYKSPAGVTYFLCESDGECTDEGETKPVLFPPLEGVGKYPTNSDGTLAVRQLIVGGIAYYLLYDTSGDEPIKLGRLPITVPVDDISFTESGESIVFRKGGVVWRYDVMVQNFVGPKMLSQTSLPFKAISPNGTYLSAYNYSEKAHIIWNLNTGARTSVSSDAPSYVEYSDDEKTIAFLDKVNGFRTLYSLDLSQPGASRITLSQPSSRVEDYTFAGNTLFFMANMDHPLTYSIYTVENHTTNRIARDVSYGDFLKAVDGKLTYIKVTGKNANVHIYDPKTSDTTELNPVGDSKVTKTITRKPIYSEGHYGALLSPKKDDADRLFVWLHGGPQRQTSVNYHSYLSYAVYDELLEKLADAGNHVLKLDYHGSTGYGDGFRTSLHKQIGIIDVAGVRKVVKDMSNELNVDEVYLIGNSYGGYLSLKTLAEDTKLFDGAISINGVTDWYNLISQIPSSPFNKLFGGPPTIHNYNSYLAASAYTGLLDNVDDEKILVVYGDSDSSVPTWQSTQYVNFAETNNKNVEMLKLEGEDHVLKKRSSLTKLCERIESFFDLPGVDCKE